MATRNGKIGRLPFQIREQLNIRICNGEPGNKLVDWLNGAPAVIDVLDTYFRGRPISEQNLSEWRNGGYQQWATLNACLGETTALSESAGLIVENGIDSQDLLLVICAHYAGMIQRWNLTPPEDLDRMMNIFKNLTNAVLAIRRSEQRDARLEIDRERLELLREKQGNKSPSSSSSPVSTSSETTPTHSSGDPDPIDPVHSESPILPRTPAACPSPASSPAAASPTPSAIDSQRAPSIPPTPTPDRPRPRAGGSPTASSPRNPSNLV